MAHNGAKHNTGKDAAMENDLIHEHYGDETIVVTSSDCLGGGVNDLFNIEQRIKCNIV